MGDFPDLDWEPEPKLESSGEDSTDGYAARPRFKGPKSTWRYLASEEIALAESMLKLRSQDLAAHLYNAHAMKRGHYDGGLAGNAKGWASKDRWMDTVEKEGDEENSKFVPPKLWTAWPMEPKTVPRSGERVGVGDGAEKFTFKRREGERPSRELEEILAGVVLKKAKEKFLARSFEDDEEGGRDASVSGAGGKQASLSDHDTSGNDSRDAEQQLFVEMDTRRPSIEESSDDGSEYQPDRPIGTIEFVPLKQPSEAPSMLPKLGAPDAPVISTDDERSRQLLRPTIRHTLSRLDSLLTALHHSRQACLNYDSLADEGRSPAIESPAKSPSAVESLASTKRSVGRPRKIINYDEPPLPSDRGRKSARGRKKKLHAPLPGELHHEMLVRIAREQRKAIPFPSSPSQSQPTSRSPSRARSSSHSRSRARRAAKLNPRDWSEVIGAAALIGFPPDVVSRAATRCAKLFGEGMVMRELVEKGEDGMTVYHPDMIPDLPPEEADSDAEVEAEHNRWRRRNRSASASASPYKRFGRRTPSRRLSTSYRQDRSRSRTGTPGTPDVDMLEQLDDRPYPCPLPTCTRATTGSGFVSLTALKSHLTHAHKMGKEEVEKAAESDDGGEMWGGVHRDGFLKPLRRRKGWRGVDRSPVKRVRGLSRKRKGSEVEEAKGEENVAVVESDDEVLHADTDVDDGDGDGNIADADEDYESGGDVEEA